MRRRLGALAFLAIAAFGVALVLRPDVGTARNVRGAAPAGEATHETDRDSSQAFEGRVRKTLDDLRRRPVHSVQGTVSDADRKEPFAGARVRLFPVTDVETSDPWAEGVPALGRPTHETVTDHKGHFGIGDDSVPRILVVDAPGYLPVLHFTERCLCHDVELSRGAARRVRAVDPAGVGIESAEALILNHGGPPRATARAGAGGYFDLALAPEDHVVVGAPGYARVFEDPMEVETVVLEPERRLKGVVVTAAGEPVADVALTLHVEPWPRKGATGADGTFTFDGLGDGVLSLDVEPEGRPSRRHSVWPGDETVRIVLCSATVRGVVTLAGGGPATGAFVSAAGVGAHADESGRFELKDVPAGEVALSAAWRGEDGVEVNAGADLYLEDGEEIERDLVLVPAVRSKVLVRVLDPDGRPASASVQAWGSDDWLGGFTHFGTDDAGLTTVEVRDPPGTTLSLWARSPHRSWRGGEDPVPHVASGSAETTADGSGPEAVLRLREPVPVTFIFRRADGGPLLSGTRIDVRLGDGEWLESGVATPDRCLLRCVAEGHAYLSVQAQGCAPVWISPFKPPKGGDEFEIRLERAVRISGRVVRPDGTPVADAFLREGIPPLERLFYDREDPPCPTEVAAAPGETVLLSAGEGMDARWFSRVEVPRDREVLDLGDIVLSPPVAVRGVVLGPGGEPLGGVRVSLDPSMTSFDAPCVTRPDGRFEIEAPPWDETRVIVEKDGFATDPIALPAFRDGPKTIRMQVAATLVAEGRMCDLAVRRVDGDASWHPQEDCWTKRVVAALPPGRFVVEAKGDGWTDTRETELSPGKTTRLALGPR